jgi:hypothetical protein
MKSGTKRLLFWTPRILCIVFIVFVSLFALDVFNAGLGFWETVLALLIHLIPSAVLAGVLAISWRWEWVGGILFTGVGLAYLVMTWGRFAWYVYVFMSGPPIIVGILFLIGWFRRDELRGSP